MDQLDIYYRALLNYKALISEDRDANNLRKAISGTDAENEKLSVRRAICTVDEDWINAIEEGLIHVEKAIKEERQFIHSNGEVMPIEKVKHISKESVQHLAKHSEMITHVHESEDLIPDKLYSVERLNDYAVYENRFLYMLLCYLRDFITIRYNKILELSNKYEGTLQVKKEMIFQKQKLTYSIDLHDERKDDKYLRDHNSAKAVIDRIDIILKTVLAFLGTPLMECAAKTAMLKPPITKTNVLKMDNNFKGAVALYDFIIAYDKPGYTVEERIVDATPLSLEAENEFSDICALLAFFTYEQGLGLGENLKHRYDREEQRLNEEKIRQKKERLEALKRRLAGYDGTTEDYILSLEKQVKLLQNEIVQLDPLRAEIDGLKATEEDLNLRIEKMKDENEKLQEDIAHSDDKYRVIIENVRSDCNERIHENILKHESEIHEMEKVFGEETEKLHKEIRSAKESWRSEISEARAMLNEAERKYEELLSSFERLSEEKDLANAKIKALKAEQGLMTEADDFTEKESFEALEKEFMAYLNFYEVQWDQAKKKIRKKILNYKNLKG